MIPVSVLFDRVAKRRGDQALDDEQDNGDARQRQGGVEHPLRQVDRWNVVVGGDDGEMAAIPDHAQDRKSGVYGTRVSVRVDLGVRRIIKKKKLRKKQKQT